MITTTLAHYTTLWGLTPDGVPFDTPLNWLLHVRTHNATPAVLKVPKSGMSVDDEKHAAAMLIYYAGLGAIRLLKSDTSALLLERACGTQSLWAMTTSGNTSDDDAAAHILADTLTQLHAPRTTPPPSGLMSLDQWFQPLRNFRTHALVLESAATLVEKFIATTLPPHVLHGDMHHQNVVHDTKRGWLAIDPKGLCGERTYDVANLLRNPQYHPAIVHDPARMQRLAHLYALRLNLDPRRILQFTAAHAALSAAWSLEDGRDPAFNLRTSEVAASCFVH